MNARSSSRAGSPLLFGLAPRGVFLASPVARRAVGSYPTVSPLPAKVHLNDDEQVPLLPVTAANFRGGLFSVALSVNRNDNRLAAATVTSPLALPGALPLLSADADRCPDFPPVYPEARSTEGRALRST